jgi:hypothetical protein
MGFTVRSVRPRIRQNVLAATVASASLLGLYATPTAHASGYEKPSISDCLGRENGYDHSDDLTNKEYARAENHRAGYGNHATCRFVITDKSRYVDLSQKVTSDTYGACEGPAWDVELTAGESVARSKAKSREKTKLKRHERSHERSVTHEISASLATLLTYTLSRTFTVGHLDAREHSRTKGDTTEYTDTKTDEKTSIVNVPEGKRVYFQYAPWVQKSHGYLEMTYWGGEYGDDDNRVVKRIDLSTHTPILKKDKTPRLDYQTKWLDCAKGNDEKKKKSAKKSV